MRINLCEALDVKEDKEFYLGDKLKDKYKVNDNVLYYYYDAEWIESSLSINELLKSKITKIYPEKLRLFLMLLSSEYHNGYIELTHDGNGVMIFKNDSILLPFSIPVLGFDIDFSCINTGEQIKIQDILESEE